MCLEGHIYSPPFLGALRNDQLTAPCVFDGPMNGQCFCAYVEQQLVPALEPGDIVVMDNFGRHKAATIQPAECQNYHENAGYGFV